MNLPANAQTDRNLQIAALHMQGMPQDKIAKKFKLTQGRISQVLKTDECVKYFIDAGTRTLASMIPKVTRNYDRMLDSEDDSVALRANQDVLKNTGITPSHTQNITINNIMQTNNVMADPEIMQALKEALAPNREIIDIG